MVHRDAWHPLRCIKPAKVFKNDKWWCTQHNPDVEKKRGEEARKRGEMRDEQRLALGRAHRLLVKIMANLGTSPSASLTPEDFNLAQRVAATAPRY